MEDGVEVGEAEDEEAEDAVDDDEDDGEEDALPDCVEGLMGAVGAGALVSPVITSLKVWASLVASAFLR